MSDITIRVKDEDGDIFVGFDKTVMGYDGHVCFNGTNHDIRITQSSPIGSINFWLDCVGAGCWASGSFAGADITTRDLQWCAHWAIEAARHKHSEMERRK